MRYPVTPRAQSGQSVSTSAEVPHLGLQVCEPTPPLIVTTQIAVGRPIIGTTAASGDMCNRPANPVHLWRRRLTENRALANRSIGRQRSEVPRLWTFVMRLAPAISRRMLSRGYARLGS